MRALCLFSVCTLMIASAISAQETKEPAPAGPSLVERLGFAPNARVLIINADDFGMNHSANEGTIKALKTGAVTSSTIMVCCPWAEGAIEFASKQPQANLGVHTTLTSEWKRYKWGPVLGRTAVPSLCTDKGYFYEDVMEIYALAKLDEAEKELIVKALKASGGNRTEAARQLGISRRTLHRKLNEFGIRESEEA